MGVSGNEIANKCAKYGSALPASCEVSDIGRPVQHILSEVKGAGRTMADRHWVIDTMAKMQTKVNIQALTL